MTARPRIRRLFWKIALTLFVFLACGFVDAVIREVWGERFDNLAATYEGIFCVMIWPEFFGLQRAIERNEK